MITGSHLMSMDQVRLLADQYLWHENPNIETGPCVLDDNGNCLNEGKSPTWIFAIQRKKDKSPIFNQLISVRTFDGEITHKKAAT